jgi:hypothetical protein
MTTRSSPASSVLRQLAVALLVTACCAREVSAQSAFDISLSNPSQTVVGDRSPLAAGLLEWFTIPTVGYAYAGDWSRGIPSALVRVAGAALALPRINIHVREPGSVCPGLCAVGLFMVLGGHVWATIDAARTTTRMNEQRRASPRVSVLPRVDEQGAGIAVRVVLAR